MPSGSPFTLLCRVALAPRGDRADLHAHTTASDGRYTPKQLLDVAVRTGLAAVAVTDHDTLAGSIEALRLAPPGLEVVPAVELSCEVDGRETHVLGYFVDPSDPALNAALTRLCTDRAGRYGEMVGRLRRLGVGLPDSPGLPAGSPGRRHLAAALVAAGRVGSVREAFDRYLDDGGPADVPKTRLEFAAGVALIRAAGGVASLAHPGPRVDRPTLARFRDNGLGAIEAEYPGFTNRRIAQLRTWAGELGLAVTGGSDCHGPDEPRRALGARTVSLDELAILRTSKDPARC